MDNKRGHLINIDEVRTQILNDIIAHNEHVRAKTEAYIEERQARIDFVDDLFDIIRLFILFG